MLEKEKILNGNLWSIMISMSLPGIINMMLVSLDSFVDSIYVGQLVGANALAGVSLSLPLTIITMSITGMVTAGSASFLSRAIGSGNVYFQERIFSHVLIMCILASIILSVPGYFFARDMVALMGASGEVLEYGANYYQTLIIGSFFTIFAVASGSLIRAEGKIKQVLIFRSISVVCNIIFNPIFIKWFDLGVRGSAISTIVSMCIYSLLTLVYFFSGKSSFHVGKISLKIETTIISSIVSVGASALIMQSTAFIRQVFIFKSMAHYGNAHEIAFLGAVFRIFMFSIIPVFGLLQALQPVVGINYGAKQYTRSIHAVKVFTAGGVLLLLVLWLPSMICPDLVLSLMLPGIQFSERELFNFRMVMCFLPLTPFASAAITFFQAIGKGKLASYLTFGRQLLLFLPLILLIPFFTNESGIYYTITAENILFVTIMFFISRYEFRKLQRPIAIAS